MGNKLQYTFGRKFSVWILSSKQVMIVCKMLISSHLIYCNYSHENRNINTCLYSHLNKVAQDTEDDFKNTRVCLKQNHGFAFKAPQFHCHQKNV